MIEGGAPGSVQLLSPSVTPAIWPWPITTTAKSGDNPKKPFYLIYYALMIVFLVSYLFIF